jgi:hypothetical protein
MKERVRVWVERRKRSREIVIAYTTKNSEKAVRVA